jgi:hypothetical protein
MSNHLKTSFMIPAQFLDWVKKYEPGLLGGIVTETQTLDDDDKPPTMKWLGSTFTASTEFCTVNLDMGSRAHPFVDPVLVNEKACDVLRSKLLDIVPVVRVVKATISNGT